MRRWTWLILAGFGLLLSAPARGAIVGSTFDEWASRFLPETGPKIELPEYADAYDRARAELQAGRYRAVLSTLAGIGQPDARRVALLRADALQGLGETDQARAALTGPELEQDPEARLLLGRLALEAHDPRRALEAADALLQLQPDSLAGRLLRGEALEQLNEYEKAIAAYHWFIEGPQAYLQKWQTDREQFESADDLTTIATAVHRWATLTMAYKDVRQLNDTVLSMYLRAFDVIDREHADSRLAAARFLLERGNNQSAQTHLAPLEAAGAGNRHLLKVLAETAMASANESALRQIASLMRANDPDSVDAEILDIYAAAHPQPNVAAARAADLFARHSQRMDVLGLHAALEYIMGGQARLDALLKKADATAPRGTVAHGHAAMLLEMKTQRDAAIGVLTTMLQRTPWDTSARHMLGDIYLNDGMDAEARAVLEEAYALDPYNIRTVNFLRLLDELAKYEKHQSEHLVIYFDRDRDPITASQIGPFMERTYKDVTEIFGYTPTRQVIVQVYPDDAEFSVRMAGVPGIENYGVSFGRVLATVAPRPGTQKGNFNWARVLRHEFVHTINLLQTQERCPRWLTEGLAVWQEGVPFRFDGVPREMWTRAEKNELFTVRGLAMAFIRPKQASDSEQAYTQGSWLARYMEATYGRESIVRLLEAYASAKGDEEAFESATGVKLAEFEPAWHAWVKQQIQGWNYDEGSDKTAAALHAEGEAFLKARNWPEALKVWEQAHALQPTELKPHQRLAFLYMQKDVDQPAKAIEHLKFLHIFELQNNRFAKQIARLYERQGDFPNAIEWALQSTYVDLYDASAHELLSRVHQQAGDERAAEAARQTVAQIKLWDLKRRRGGSDEAGKAE